MRHFIAGSFFIVIAGCSFSPPKPQEVAGEYRPINISKSASPTGAKPIGDQRFNFRYEGDISSSLEALRVLQPQLAVMPSIGASTPLQVRIDLSGTTLENAVRSIGEQGGQIAEVVWITTKGRSVNQVFLRYRFNDKQASSGDAEQKPSKE